jgi:general secretion pathway protein J
MRHRLAGFTLVEILIALFIFAILATIATLGLQSVIKSKERTELHATELQELQLAISLLQHDLLQAIDRPILDNDSSPLPSFYAPRPNYFEFTHSGFNNPQMGQVRSNLQRVAYEWNNQSLTRLTWEVLDRSTDSEPQQKIILKNVKNFRVRFLAKNQQYYSKWPAETGSASTALPLAVEITLTLAKTQIVYRLFLTPTAGSTDYNSTAASS